MICFNRLATHEFASALVSLGGKADLAEASMLLEECTLIFDYNSKDTHHGRPALVARRELERLKMK